MADRTLQANFSANTAGFTQGTNALRQRLTELNTSMEQTRCLQSCPKSRARTPGNRGQHSRPGRLCGTQISRCENTRKNCGSSSRRHRTAIPPPRSSVAVCRSFATVSPRLPRSWARCAPQSRISGGRYETPTPNSIISRLRSRASPTTPQLWDRC